MDKDAQRHFAAGWLLGDDISGGGPTPPTPTPVYGDSVLEEILSNSFVIGTVCTYGAFRVELRLWQSSGMYTGGFSMHYRHGTVSPSSSYPDIDNSGMHTPCYNFGGGIAVFIVFKNSTPIYANTWQGARSGSSIIIGSGVRYNMTNNNVYNPPYYNKIVNYMSMYWDASYDITKASIEITEPIHDFSYYGSNQYFDGFIKVGAQIRWTSIRHDIHWAGDNVGWEETSSEYTLSSGADMWWYDNSASTYTKYVHILPFEGPTTYGCTYFSKNLSSIDIRNLVSEFIYTATLSFNSSAQPAIWVDSM